FKRNKLPTSVKTTPTAGRKYVPMFGPGSRIAYAGFFGSYQATTAIPAGYRRTTPSRHDGRLSPILISSSRNRTVVAVYACPATRYENVMHPSRAPASDRSMTAGTDGHESEARASRSSPTPRTSAPIPTTRITRRVNNLASMLVDARLTESESLWL